MVKNVLNFLIDGGEAGTPEDPRHEGVQGPEGATHAEHGVRE